MTCEQIYLSFSLQLCTKNEHDDAVFAIGTLAMVEPCPNIYNLPKLKKISTHTLLLFHSLNIHQSGWAEIFVKSEIYALSER